jgi:hypothetical protein
MTPKKSKGFIVGAMYKTHCKNKPMSMQYVGNGRFHCDGKVFYANILKRSIFETAIFSNPDLDAIFSETDVMQTQENATFRIRFNRTLADCSTDGEKQELVTEYIAEHTGGAVSHSSLIRVFGKEITTVCNDMVANGTLGKYRKKNISGGNNAYYALPDSKAKGMEA